MIKYQYDNFWIGGSDYKILLFRLGQIFPGGRHKRSVKMDLYLDQKNDKYIYVYKIDLNTLDYKLISTDIRVQYSLNGDSELCAMYNSSSARKKLIKFIVFE